VLPRCPNEIYGESGPISCAPILNDGIFKRLVFRLMAAADFSRSTNHVAQPLNFSSVCRMWAKGAEEVLRFIRRAARYAAAVARRARNLR